PAVGLAQHRLMPALVGQQVPAPVAGLVDPLLDGKSADRLDEVHRAGAEAVEVAGEQRVRAAQLAGAALGAVDVVGGDVLHRPLALLHRDDVGVERGRRPRLVALDLHDRAHLAAELVTAAVAVVRSVAPLLHELVGAAHRHLSLDDGLSRGTYAEARRRATRPRAR